MPTDSTVTTSVIDPIAETVEELERAVEGALVHIAGPETITGLKTFTQPITAPSFVGILSGHLASGIIALGPIDMNGFGFLNVSGTGFELLANKGAANGYAPLGAGGLVPAANLGTGGNASGTNFLADDGTFKPISAGSVSFGTQTANTIFAGPGSGSAATPGFRALAVADIPALPESKIANLIGDLLGKVTIARTITEGAGLAGNTYDLTANRTLALGTPSLLSVISTNSVSGTTHTHQIVTSSNPDDAAAILATDASGFLTLRKLTLTVNLLINALTANLFLKDTSTGFQVATTGVVTPQAGNIWRNTSYTSGLQGWNIDDDGNAEFNNLTVRGAIKASVFTVNEIAATAGTLGVFYSAATVQDDFTTPASTSSSFAFNAKNSDAGGMLFAVGDIVRFKTWTGSGISDAWATITARVNHTTYATYTATLNSGSTSATFPAGTAAVDYGPSGTGFITLSADGTVGSTPNMTMATHAGSPWSAQTILLRAGNLNGSYGYATNVYGVGLGKYASGANWLTFDTTNGIRIGNNTTTLGQWTTSGSILIGKTGAGQSYLEFDSTYGIRVWGNQMLVGQWDTSGNVTFGNVATDQANVYWNNSNKRLQFRGSTSGTVVQSYIDTDGSWNSGDGFVRLLGTGLVIRSSSESEQLNSVSFDTSDAHTIGRMYAAHSGGGSGAGFVTIQAVPYGGSGAGTVTLLANSAGRLLVSDTDSRFYAPSGFVGVTIGSNTAPAHMLDVYGSVWLNGSLIIATTATPASAGATGVTGTVVWDTSFIYVAVGTNTWKRAAIATW
jgi:hypothetical protein